MLMCCPGGAAGDFGAAFCDDYSLWVKTGADGEQSLDLIVPELVSAGSIPLIENALVAIPGIVSARVNLTLKRVEARWTDTNFQASSIPETLACLGFTSRPFDRAQAGFANDDAESGMLLRSVAISGFAAANIMLLSVSVWSGAEAATRDLFHWISAAIALPTVLYAGRPFFRSAWRAVSFGRFNMDVPISLAVCLAALMSLAETARGGEVAYFDASVTLLFFLLIGRYLDHMMRARARSAVSRLLALRSASATVEEDDGQRRAVAASTLRAGMRMVVAAGERFAADGLVEGGRSEIDRSLVTGESLPERVSTGSQVHAGMLNLTAPLIVAVTAAGKDTFLSEVARLMEAAEEHRSRFVRAADRLARIYSPAVHVLAATTFIGWVLWTGGDWHSAMMAAIAVLIITCPCALGLAVPAVQTVASGVLFRNDILLKDGSALEKLAAIDTVVFDKTGTLTLGRPMLLNVQEVGTHALSLAAGLASASRHPLSRAVCAAAERAGVAAAAATNVEEHPGEGLSGQIDGKPVRLGSRLWAGIETETDGADTEFVLAHDGRHTVFTFADELRGDAVAAIDALKAGGIAVAILSGDREGAVASAARALGIETWQAAMTPQQKLAHVEALRAAGHRVLMVGDGINDAPALAAGFTSMAPSSASDIGQIAADTVFMGDGLSALLRARDIAIRANRLMRQNFALAIGYNVFAVPVAMLGHATPLVAAIAMSTSSMIVVANALRLDVWRPRRPPSNPAAARLNKEARA